MPPIPYAEKRSMCSIAVTLNGRPAKISGAANDFATITDLQTGLSCEFAWPTVVRLIETKNGDFRS